MNILVINCGSSSLKYQLIDSSKEEVLAKGLCERIGIDGSCITHQPMGGDKVKTEVDMPDHTVAVKMVIEKLKEYPIMKKKLYLLSFEMEHMMRVSETDVLQTMAQALSSWNNTSQSGNTDLDRVMAVALSYRDRATTLNNETSSAIIQEWDEIYRAVSRIDFYMSLLTEEERNILILSYMEKLSWKELETILGFSRRTIIRRRDAAVERIKELLNYATSIVV